MSRVSAWGKIVPLIEGQQLRAARLLALDSMVGVNHLELEFADGGLLVVEIGEVRRGTGLVRSAFEVWLEPKESA